MHVAVKALVPIRMSVRRYVRELCASGASGQSPDF
jgi:hypothetical protein